MSRPSTCSILLLFVASVPAQLHGATIHVPADQPTIQAGVDHASPGDIVLVANGIYYEHDILIVTDIILRSDTGQATSVTIDAEGLGRGFLCTAVGPDGLIEGFTVRNAVSYGAWPTGNGAGLRCDSSSLTIRNCVFRDGIADDYGLGGGALTINGSAPTFEDCKFIGNHAEEDGGGFVASLSSSPVLIRCEFRGNTAPDVGGFKCEAQSTAELRECLFIDNRSNAFGGALCAGGTTMRLSECEFVENEADLVGGALGANENTNLIVENCRFIDNHSPGQAGAIRVVLSNATIRDCVFIRNVCGSPGTVAPGGAVLADRGHVEISNSTFVANSAGLGGCVYVAANTDIDIARCILSFTNGTRAIDCASGAQVAVACSNFFGNASGDGLECLDEPGSKSILFTDPLFCDVTTDDLTLRDESPCLPDNNPCATLIGAFGQGCGTVSITETSWGRLKSLYR